MVMPEPTYTHLRGASCPGYPQRPSLSSPGADEEDEVLAQGEGQIQTDPPQNIILLI